MKEIVLKYLNQQYRFTLSTYSSYKLYDKIEKRDVGLREALLTLPTIFDIKPEEVHEIFDEWADRKAIEINNNVIDIRFKLYEKTGIELELTPNDLNRLMEVYDTLDQEMDFSPYMPKLEDPTD